MSGKTIILEAGQTLFKRGDPSNGMYLVRQGELVVYIEENGQQVVLARIAAGGMIGEMALFDHKPRSASVKSVAKSEVTHISNDDFQKLVKQIPKWFTGLMGTLSGRLRATNDRLQQVETKVSQSKDKMQIALRVLYALDLMWHRDSNKDGKEWVLEKQGAISGLAEMFQEEPSFVEKVIRAVSNEKIVTVKKDSLKRDVLTLPQRGALAPYLQFISQFLKNPLRLSVLPLPAHDLLQALRYFSERSAYDSFSVTLAELEVEGNKAKMRTIPEWPKHLDTLTKLYPDDFQVTRATAAISIKTRKAEIQEIARFQMFLSNLYRELQA